MDIWDESGMNGQYDSDAFLNHINQMMVSCHPLPDACPGCDLGAILF